MNQTLRVCYLALVYLGTCTAAPPIAAQIHSSSDLPPLYAVDSPLLSRSISWENPTGAPGEGGQTSSPLGVGRKGAPQRFIPANTTVTLVEIEGPATIRHIWMTGSPHRDPRQLRSAIVRAYWDGQKHPSVECPLGDWMGMAHCNVAPYESAVHSVGENAALNLWLPMPFTKNARITVSNDGNTTLGLYYQIDYTIGERHPRNIGRLHTLFRRENPTSLTRDFELLPERNGAGRFIGCLIGVRALDTKRWWGEGEIKFFMDGDQEFPTICGTGVEDYVCQSYGVQERPYLYHGTALNQDGFVTMYRWHLPDPIYWKKNCRATIQQIGIQKGGLYERSDDWSCATFWYEAVPSAPLPVLPSRDERLADISIRKPAAKAASTSVSQSLSVGADGDSTRAELLLNPEAGMTREERIKAHHERIASIFQENRKKTNEQHVMARAWQSAPKFTTAPGTEDPWKQSRRGSWLVDSMQADALAVVSATSVSLPIVLSREEPFVSRAAQFLADDIERISGIRPKITDKLTTDGPAIHLHTLAESRDIFPVKTFNAWESYRIRVTTSSIWILGSNPRGTAFGVYELCERLGVDPLHLFSGIKAPNRFPLLVKPVEYRQGPPTFRFRGFFHDDEDILPRPKVADGKPDTRGRVPDEWYARYFETALRLRMNMVAPYTRTIRTPGVQKMASDWGLYYTSHHYDTLLSDPYHFDRGQLAQKRGVDPPTYDWLTNREGIIKYWRGGMEETRDLHCIWPIGLRGTEDYGYRWPQEWGNEQKADQFNQAFQTQANLVDEFVPRSTDRLSHFTMYTEMLPIYQSGLIKLPKDTILIWPDNNDGYMRGLPASKDPQSSVPRALRNGVYYHLAFLGSNLTKQLFPTVRPEVVEQEFRRIIEADATEFCLVNVSELREFVQGARMVSDICWNGKSAFAEPTASDRFYHWWSAEYFGESAANSAAAAYRAYFDLFPHPTLMGYAGENITSACTELKWKVSGRAVDTTWCNDALTTMQARVPSFESLARELSDVRHKIKSSEARTFFFENLELGLEFERLSNLAAIEVVSAHLETTTSIEGLRPRLEKSLVSLDELDLKLRRANRWPFENWYDMSAFRWRNRRLMDPRQLLIELLSTDNAK